MESPDDFAGQSGTGSGGSEDSSLVVNPPEDGGVEEAEGEDISAMAKGMTKEFIDTAVDNVVQATQVGEAGAGAEADAPGAKDGDNVVQATQAGEDAPGAEAGTNVVQATQAGEDAPGAEAGTNVVQATQAEDAPTQAGEDAPGAGATTGAPGAEANAGAETGDDYPGAFEYNDQANAESIIELVLRDIEDTTLSGQNVPSVFREFRGSYDPHDDKHSIYNYNGFNSKDIANFYKKFSSNPDKKFPLCSVGELMSQFFVCTPNEKVRVGRNEAPLQRLYLPDGLVSTGVTPNNTLYPVYMILCNIIMRRAEDVYGDRDSTDNNVQLYTGEKTLLSDFNDAVYEYKNNAKVDFENTYLKWDSKNEKQSTYQVHLHRPQNDAIIHLVLMIASLKAKKARVTVYINTEKKLTLSAFDNIEIILRQIDDTGNEVSYKHINLPTTKIELYEEHMFNGLKNASGAATDRLMKLKENHLRNRERVHYDVSDGLIQSLELKKGK